METPETYQTNPLDAASNLETLEITIPTTPTYEDEEDIFGYYSSLPSDDNEPTDLDYPHNRSTELIKIFKDTPTDRLLEMFWGGFDIRASGIVNYDPVGPLIATAYRAETMGFEARFILGIMCYYNIHFTRRDWKKERAIEFFTTAARALGHRGALLYLGHMRYMGENCVQDFEDAKYLFLRAGNANYPAIKEYIATIILKLHEHKLLTKKNDNPRLTDKTITVQIPKAPEHYLAKIREYEQC
jgi:hypothetical protein